MCCILSVDGSKMKRSFKWLVILAVLGTAAAAAYTGQVKNWGRPRESIFRELPVVRGEVTEVVNSTGTIQPVLKVQIGSIVSGPIKSIEVDYNSQVKAGDILAHIDPRTFDAVVAKDEATLARQNAERERVAVMLEQAVNNEKRARALKKANPTFISTTEIDKVAAERKALDAQLKLAGASVQEAEASLKVSKANLGYTVITSPVDGTVIDRLVDPGQTLASQFQTPTMFIIAPEMDQRMFVYASVDEADIGLICEAKDRSEPVTFTVDAYPDDLFQAKVVQIRLNPTTVQNVVTYTVVVEAPNQDLRLLPGMTASLSFQIKKRDGILKIPNAALRFFPQPEQVRTEDRALVKGITSSGPDQSDTQGASRSAAQKAEAARLRNCRHVWVAQGELLMAIEVTTGLSDSQYTESASDDLREGQQLVTGLRTE